MISAQDKILHVANKLGLTSLKDMQATTGAVYAVDQNGTGTCFTNVQSLPFPVSTNLTDNKFEVNEALLVESISFCRNGNGAISRPQFYYGSNVVCVFDLIIGNKTVLKNTPIWFAGGPNTFASVSVSDNNVQPRAQVFLEGVGILIPPQVEFYINYAFYNTVTGAKISNTAESQFTLFGTQVLLNFNTSI